MNKDQGKQKDAHGAQQQGDQKGKDEKGKHEQMRQADQKGMHGDQKNDKGRPGQEQRQMDDEQDKDLGRPVRVGQGDHRSQNDREGGKSEEKEDASKSRQPEPRR